MEIKPFWGYTIGLWRLEIYGPFVSARDIKVDRRLSLMLFDPDRNSNSN